MVDYAAAQQEWNDRYFNQAKVRRNFQIALACSLAMNLVQACGLTGFAFTSKTVPYVVEVDHAGNVRAIGHADRAPGDPDDALLYATLRHFIEHARTVIADPVAQKRVLKVVYAHATKKVATQLNTFYRQPIHNPFTRAQRETVAVQVTSILPLSAQTYKISWREITRSLTGEIVNKSTHEAVLSYDQLMPDDAATISVNPYGVFITELAWTELLPGGA